MPLVMDRRRIPDHWVGEPDCYLVSSTEETKLFPNCLRIALIVNMPDTALQDTEAQFFALLRAAARDLSVFVNLYSLPNIPRTERAQHHLDNFYLEIRDLLGDSFDGLIMTGTEPHQANLKDEPYWGALAEVLDWSEENTASTVLSCLAAHAGVLHRDGIGRHCVGDKRFGVFEHHHVSEHYLTSGTDNPIRVPHSRWNEVGEETLTSCGYQILTKSSEAGVDLFIKEKKGSLFLHFQGHPEYGSRTLLKEYLRDIKRYLRKERKCYPSVPGGYFDTKTTELLAHFQEAAQHDTRETLIESFPEAQVAHTLENTWQKCATRVYANWLQYLLHRKEQTGRRVFARNA